MPGWRTASIRCETKTRMVLSDHGIGNEVLNLSEPASYFGGSPAGGLGWGIGGGLGMKLARPEKTVIVTAGDGTYMFNNPTACHFVSEAYDCRC